MSPTDQETVRRMRVSKGASRAEARVGEPHRSRDEDNNVLASRAEARVGEPPRSRAPSPRSRANREPPIKKHAWNQAPERKNQYAEAVEPARSQGRSLRAMGWSIQALRGLKARGLRGAQACREQISREIQSPQKQCGMWHRIESTSCAGARQGGGMRARIGFLVRKQFGSSEAMWEVAQHRMHLVCRRGGKGVACVPGADVVCVVRHCNHQHPGKCLAAEDILATGFCQQKRTRCAHLCRKRLRIGAHVQQLPRHAEARLALNKREQPILLARARDPFCSIASRRPCRPRGPSSCRSPAVRRSKWISSSKRGRNVQRTQHAARVLDDLPKEHHPRCPSIDLSPCKKAPAAPPRPCLGSRLAHERAASPSCPRLSLMREPPRHHALGSRLSLTGEPPLLPMPSARSSGRPRCPCPLLAPRSRESCVGHARASIQWAPMPSARASLTRELPCPCPRLDPVGAHALGSRLAQERAAPAACALSSRLTHKSAALSMLASRSSGPRLAPRGTSCAPPVARRPAVSKEASKPCTPQCSSRPAVSKEESKPCTPQCSSRRQAPSGLH